MGKIFYIVFPLYLFLSCKLFLPVHEEVVAMAFEILPWLGSSVAV